MFKEKYNRNKAFAVCANHQFADESIGLVELHNGERRCGIDTCKNKAIKTLAPLYPVLTKEESLSLKYLFTHLLHSVYGPHRPHIIAMGQKRFDEYALIIKELNSDTYGKLNPSKGVMFAGIPVVLDTEMNTNDIEMFENVPDKYTTEVK